MDRAELGGAIDARVSSTTTFRCMATSHIPMSKSKSCAVIIKGYCTRDAERNTSYMGIPYLCGVGAMEKLLGSTVSAGFHSTQLGELSTPRAMLVSIRHQNS
jgi:hypothetical protein